MSEQEEIKRLGKSLRESDAILKVLADGRDKILAHLNKHYEGQAFEIFDKAVEHMTALEAKLSKTEEALYNTIEEGVAHAFINVDHDDKRARVLTQEEVAAAQEKRRAREALAGGEEA